MLTDAVVLSRPRDVALRSAQARDPGPSDIVLSTHASGVSTGTEKLLWSGDMPAFPGLGYPLVPGYESVGEVVEAGPESGFRPGEFAFVPGSAAWTNARGLFGGAAAHLVSPGKRALHLDPGHGETGALLALAATARHAIHNFDLPELIVGHGVLGRLLARLTVALGGAPVVWDSAAARRDGADGYPVVAPEDDPRHDYRTIYDASGAPDLVDTLLARLARGGELVLCGFYRDRMSFAFPSAFIKEARLRISAEWQPEDLGATRALVEAGMLSLDALITHRSPARDAAAAYRTAFENPNCLKLLLDWKDTA